MMFLIVLNLMVSLMGSPAFAGGVECQKNGTCQCQSQGTCDKFGHPIPRGDFEAGLHPAITECLAEGLSMDVCLKRVFPGRLGFLSPAHPVIQCGEGDEAFRVKLGLPFSQMPRDGEVPAEFENLPLALGDSVSTRILPIFHMRQISFQTAYCGFGIQVDSAGRGRDFVFSALRECEGERREISCRVL